jgi:ATP-dependent Lhr-like helicase
MPSDLELIERLGPTGRAFFGDFDRLRDVQRQALSVIFEGSDVLVASPTASGKTEAVLAPLVARLRSIRTPGIKLLAVGPTRALVNDLHARLVDPLATVGWRCGRQTSDHAEKHKRPELLITTPESFDSMLVRDGTRSHGVLESHLLATVSGIFVDEAHAFDGSARGDQLASLIGRLRRLRAYAAEHGWTPDSGLQACGASATVHQPGLLASRLFGGTPAVVQVGGSREIETLLRNEAGLPVEWRPLAGLDTQTVLGRLLRIDGREDLDATGRHVWAAIHDGAAGGCRKVLVFVPTRALCDRLSAHLRTYLVERRDLYVGAHHGSLSRERREDAEHSFADRRDAVLVATSTLELGIDIGDVDAVALIGPPPDVASLLQRIGRAGRRLGKTRVVPIARDELEARALASMLTAGCAGELDDRPSGRRWSVFVQQAASSIAQAGQRGRQRSDLIALATQVFGGEQSATRAERILDGLVEQERLHAEGGRLFLGADYSDRLRSGGGDLHNNLDAGNVGIPVVDATTGELIAHVAGAPEGTIALAGSTWRVVHESGELLVRGAKPDTVGEAFMYPTRAAPKGRAFAWHVRRGLGLAADEAPIVDIEGTLFWFHFGGAAYDVALRVLLPGLRSGGSFAGLAIRGVPDIATVRALCGDPTALATKLLPHADRLQNAVTPGPYQAQLPEEIRREVVVELLDVPAFTRWLGTRVIDRASPAVTMRVQEAVLEARAPRAPGSSGP